MKANEQAAIPTGRNLFILGAARSGTTKLAELVKDMFGYSGDLEGHAFRYLRHATMDRHEIIRSVPPGAYDFYSVGHDAIEREMTLAIFRVVRSRFGGSNWFDKTPTTDMLAAAPLLAKYIPNSCFIYIQRNGLHCVASSLSKWPALSFEKACRNWAESLTAFLSVRDQLPQLLTVSMEQMVADPVGLTRSVAWFLGAGFPTDEAIFEFFKRPSSSSLVAPAADMRGISEMGWSEQKQATFRDICGPCMAAFYPYSDLRGKTQAAKRTILGWSLFR